MQECEKIYSVNIRSFFLKTIQAMIKHFKNILRLIYQTFQRRIKFDYYVYRFFTEAHVLHTAGKTAYSLDQTRSNYSNKLTQLDCKYTKENDIRTGFQAQIDCRDETEIN